MCYAFNSLIIVVPTYCHATDLLGGVLLDQPPFKPDQASIVETYDTLLQAIESGAPLIEIPGDVEIVIPNRPSPLHLKKNQVLFSFRGYQGSRGALLKVETNTAGSIDDYPIIIMDEASRITGLRLEGPVQIVDSEKRTIGIQTKSETDHQTIDNCEVYGWPWAAISIKQSKGVNVHHNFIHHNIKHDYGYGVVLQNGNSEAFIASNVFDYNRHSIAASGQEGEAYTAFANLVLSHGGRGAYHQFDMHANANDHFGGLSVTIIGNWFNYGDYGTSNRSSILLRGIPKAGPAVIEDNVFHSPYMITDQITTIAGVEGSRMGSSILIKKNLFDQTFRFTKDEDHCSVILDNAVKDMICEALELPSNVFYP